MGIVLKDKITERPVYRELSPYDPGITEGWLEAYGYDSCEPKLDGIWGRIEVSGIDVRVYSRHGQLKSVFPFHSSRFHARPLVLHSEYMFGSNWAIRMGLQGQAFVFDCTEFAGESVRLLPLESRRKYVVDAVRILNAEGLMWVKQTPVFPAVGFRDVWKRLVEREGREGLVFKNSQHGFGCPWARMKRQFEVDYVCMGFTQSDAAKYKGRMVSSIKGGLYIDGKLQEVANVSGLDESQRRAFYVRPEDFVGRVFTAFGKDVYDRGNLRHPNFVSWHREKKPEECSLESVMQSLKSFARGGANE